MMTGLSDCDRDRLTIPPKLFTANLPSPASITGPYSNSTSTVPGPEQARVQTFYVRLAWTAWEVSGQSCLMEALPALPTT